MRWVFLLTAVAVALSVVPFDAQAKERRHVSGIALLPRRDITPLAQLRQRMGEEAFERIAGAWDANRELAERQPDLFGIPWMDLAHERLVVRVTRPEAASQVREPTTARIQVEATTRSYRTLQAIMRDAFDEPALGIRGGRARVWGSSIDEESQRVVFETDRVNETFLYALAKTYGTEAVAVRVDPRSGPFSTDPQATLTPVTGVSDTPGDPALMAAVALSAVLPIAGAIALRRRRVL